MDYLEAIAPRRVLNDVHFFPAHPGVATAQVQGKFNDICLCANSVQEFYEIFRNL